MVRVRNLTKTLVLVIAVQAACLAMGLWIHDRFVVSSAQWLGNQRTWEELVITSRDVAASLTPLRWNELTPDTEDFQVAKSAFDAFTLPEGSVALLVDTKWRVILAHSTSDVKSGRLWKRGQRVLWAGPSKFSDSPWQSSQGTLQTPDGPRPALAYPLQDSQGYMLFSLTKETGDLSVGSLLQTFPIMRAISFVWICSLQSLVVCAILLRIYNERSRQKTKSDEDTLRRTQDLVRTRDAVIFGLAKLAESRDRETGHHLERISLYSTRLTSVARQYPKFRDAITPAFVRLIGISSALHDIGKVGIEDAVLLKPGRLNEQERLHIQTHPIIGADCLHKIEQRLGTSNFLQMAREIALYHHEWWDGSGYPSGVAGERIPLSARIVAISDVYDAMSVRRIYKDAISHEKCVAYIRQQAGKQFDPDLVEVFLTIELQFREIGRTYSAPPTVTDRPVVEPDGQPDREEEFLVTVEKVHELTSQLTGVS